MLKRSTLILLGIFILLLLAFIFWQRYHKEEQAEITPTMEQELLISQEMNVSDLRIEGVGGKVVEVARDDEGLWKLSIPEGFETDATSVESAIAQLYNLQVLSEFDQGLDLGGAGLLVPVYRITIVSKNGEEVVLDIGKVTATGSGYYVRKGGKEILVVSKYSLDSLLNLVENPPIIPIPTSTEAVIDETAPAPLSSEIPSVTSTP